MDLFEAVKFTKSTQGIVKHKAAEGAFMLDFEYETEEWVNGRPRARLGGHATRGNAYARVLCPLIYISSKLETTRSLGSCAHSTKTTCMDALYHYAMR